MFDINGQEYDTAVQAVSGSVQLRSDSRDGEYPLNVPSILETILALVYRSGAGDFEREHLSAGCLGKWGFGKIFVSESTFQQQFGNSILY